MKALLSESEIASRLPLWVALSALFLDTEIDTAEYEAIAKASHEGGFDKSSVRRILEEEVCPAFVFNAADVAGEWIGFPSDYVRDRVLKVLAMEKLDYPDGHTVARIHGVLMRECWPRIEAALTRA